MLSLEIPIATSRHTRSIIQVTIERSDIDTTMLWAVLICHIGSGIEIPLQISLSRVSY